MLKDHTLKAAYFKSSTLSAYEKRGKITADGYAIVGTEGKKTKQAERIAER